MRVIPPAALTGHIAGEAAVIASKNKACLHEINIRDLQEKLSATGVILNNPNPGLKTKT